jgi:hypothetical protein
MVLVIYTLLIAYMLYGIIHVLKNKTLSGLHKAVWVIAVVILPVLGTSLYLRTSFKERHGNW